MNPGEDVRRHEAGLRGSCERPNVDTEKQTQVLWKYIKVAEPSLRLPHVFL